MTYAEDLRGSSILVVAALIVLVLWVGKGALLMLTGLPVISQILQLLGLLYAAELAVGRRKLPSLPSVLPTLPPRWFGATKAPNA